MITSDQIRAARALLRWSADDLAAAAGIGVATVRRMEASDGVPSASGKNLAAVQIALETAGVQFLPARAGDHGEGVRFAWRG